jgi:hypothetical protein
MTDSKIRVAIGGKTKELTYRWTGELPIRVGDVVRVPPPYWACDTSENREKFSYGVVVGIGSTYTGPILSINQRANPDPPV